MTTGNDDPRTVLLKGIRLSFTESLKDKKKTANTDDAKEKHSVNLILERDSPHYAANVQKIGGALAAASEAKWKNPKKWETIAEDNPKRVCFRKGESFKNQDSGEVYAGYAGNKAISCGTPAGGQKRPKLLDRHKRTVAEDDILDVMYSGSYADAFVSFYGTDKGGLGVFCTVELIRSHQEGERMGGGGGNYDVDELDELEDGEDAFGDTETGSGNSLLD